MSVLTRSGLENAGVVVTRYFGGTLLGTGGLSRAYGQAAAEAVAQARVVDLYRCQLLKVTVDYAAFERLKQLWGQRRWPITETAFGADITACVAVPHASVTAFKNLTLEQTSGHAHIEEDRWVYEPLPPPEPPPSP